MSVFRPVAATPKRLHHALRVHAAEGRRSVETGIAYLVRLIRPASPP